MNSDKGKPWCLKIQDYVKDEKETKNCELKNELESRNCINFIPCKLRESSSLAHFFLYSDC